MPEAEKNIPSLRRYFYDWEFYNPPGSRYTYLPIALSIITDDPDGPEYTALFNDYASRVHEDEWVHHNVIVPLRGRGVLERTEEQVVEDLLRFIEPAEEIQMWAMQDDHDRHLLTATMGGAHANAFSKFHHGGTKIVLPRDLVHFRHYVGWPDLPSRPKGHDPLIDARWHRDCYWHLRNIAQQKGLDLSYPVNQDAFLPSDQALRP